MPMMLLLLCKYCGSGKTPHKSEHQDRNHKFSLKLEERERKILILSWDCRMWKKAPNPRKDIYFLKNKRERSSHHDVCTCLNVLCWLPFCSTLYEVAQWILMRLCLFFLSFASFLRIPHDALNGSFAHLFSLKHKTLLTLDDFFSSSRAAKT